MLCFYVIIFHILDFQPLIRDHEQYDFRSNGSSSGGVIGEMERKLFVNERGSQQNRLSPRRKVNK